MLASALLLSSYVGWTPPGSDRELATQLAHRAEELDDNDPWAHLALGFVAFTGRETEEAIRHLNKALDLNPNFATACGFVGFTLCLDGQSEEALHHFEQAMRISPRDPVNSLFVGGMAVAHYMASRYQEAIKLARKAAQLRPGAPHPLRILCASLAQAGQIEEAKAALSAFRQLQPDLSVAWIKQSVPYTSGPMAHFLEGMRKTGLTH